MSRSSSVAADTASCMEKTKGRDGGINSEMYQNSVKPPFHRCYMEHGGDIPGCHSNQQTFTCYAEWPSGLLHLEWFGCVDNATESVTHDCKTHLQNLSVWFSFFAIKIEQSVTANRCPFGTSVITEHGFLHNWTTMKYVQKPPSFLRWRAISIKLKGVERKDLS